MTYQQLLALLAANTFIPTQQTMAKVHTEHPNVILILADDMGYGDVSAYGSTTIHTPNIDRLAHEGVCFTDGHATSATSTPSRYALLTGMYPWKNKDAHILPGDAPLLISPDMPTMPKMFQQAGYTTAAIGKWHLGMGVGKIDWNKHISPCANDVGFDYSCLIAATVDRVPTVYVENGNVVGADPNDPIEVSYEHPVGNEPTGLDHPELMKMRYSHGHQNTIINGIPRIGYMKGGKKAHWKDDEMAQYLSDKVKSFIDSHADKPFFLYYGLHEPHVPRIASKPFQGTTTMGPRGDVVVEADWCVGEVIRKLESKGLLENTIVIYTSDNGPVLDDGYQDQAVELAGQHDPNGGYRGGKYSLFDAGTRVPFFVYWKGHTRPITCQALVSQQDLFASFAQMLGVKMPKGTDSQPMMDTFLGKSTKGRSDMVVEASGRLALRSGSLALIPPYKGSKTNETGNELGNLDSYSLYNLGMNPKQDTELSAESPKVLKRLKKIFLRRTKGYYNPQTKEEKLK